MFLRALAIAVAGHALAASLCLASGSYSGPARGEDLMLVRTDDPMVLTSGSTGVRFKAAMADTFALFGGPGTLEGKFQGLGFAPERQGWVGVDYTDQPAFWQVSTFCAETLNGHGTGNKAIWAGRSVGQASGWATPPGYGNNWNAALEWTRTTSVPSQAQTVGLSFVFHHDTEPNYDYFTVEYDSANVTSTVFSIDGNDVPFAAPGVRYPQDVSNRPIRFSGGDYAGPNNASIVLRLRVQSDIAWSDEDGLYPTQCGAAIVDDIAVSYDDGTGVKNSFTDFDTTNDWAALENQYAGDFSQVHPQFEDIDLCRQNPSPSIGFIDYGQCPSNARNHDGLPPCDTTGGALSPNWSYGISGGWVLNYNGGLSYGLVGLHNEVWSPSIAWDLPGSEDDDPTAVGAVLRFSIWSHLPVSNAILWVWHVRSSYDGGATWRAWADRGLAGFGPAAWSNVQIDVTDLVNDGSQPPTHVQIALGARDVSNLFAFGGSDATPAPLYDNVALLKYEIGGPIMTALNPNLFMDSFPQAGTFNFSTEPNRANADVRLDIRDVSSGNSIVPGDSMLVDVLPVIPGTDIQDVSMHWVLDRNPLFDSVRVAPAGVTVVPGGAANGWDQWTGQVPGRHPTLTGNVLENRYFFDLPDEDFFHPGDVLRYYVRADDDGGHVSTLPRELDGFESGRSAGGVVFSANFTVHALPSARSNGQGGVTSPEILVLNDYGFAGRLEGYLLALGQNGWRRGLDYDLYSSWDVSGGGSSSIGSSGAHGATPDQLVGYDVVVYLAGDLDSSLLSDGTNVGANDKADDIGVLRAWFERDGDRGLVHFGDNIASAIVNDSPAAGISYVQTVLGIDLIDADVRDAIDGQTAPQVSPSAGSPWFTQKYVAFGGCPGLNTFDNLAPLAGVSVSHRFLDILGNPYPAVDRAASLTWERFDAGTGDRKVTVTFPYSLLNVWNKTHDNQEPGFAGSARTNLLDEVIVNCLNQTVIGGPRTDADVPGFVGVRHLATTPNPFNPATTVHFEVGSTTRVQATVYSLRGERVATLHDGLLEAGKHEFVWRGRDRRQAIVASGVYVVDVRADGVQLTQKVTLLK